MQERRLTLINYSVRKDATQMYSSRDVRQNEISTFCREKEGKGFDGEHASFRRLFKVGGRCRWMIANKCLNGKNLLIMA